MTWLPLESWQQFLTTVIGFLQIFPSVALITSPYLPCPQIALTTIDHASVRKGEEAVDMIHRKNTQKKDETSHAYIMRLEYEPQLIVRKSTGRKF